ncbi:MAG: IS66 family transposase zinc-finger binding domain-containing protein, partial [Eubacteriales bacterium]
MPENSEKETIVHELSSEERLCPCCNEEMSPIGKDIHKSMKVIAAKIIQKEDHYITYACKCCEKEGTSMPILKTPRENTVIPGSFASPEAIAYLIYRNRLTTTRLVISLKNHHNSIEKLKLKFFYTERKWWKHERC